MLLNVLLFIFHLLSWQFNFLLLISCIDITIFYFIYHINFFMYYVFFLMIVFYFLYAFLIFFTKNQFLFFEIVSVLRNNFVVIYIFYLNVLFIYFGFMEPHINWIGITINLLPFNLVFLCYIQLSFFSFLQYSEDLYDKWLFHKIDFKHVVTSLNIKKITKNKSFLFEYELSDKYFHNIDITIKKATLFFQLLTLLFEKKSFLAFNHYIFIKKILLYFLINPKSNKGLISNLKYKQFVLFCNREIELWKARNFEVDKTILLFLAKHPDWIENCIFVNQKELYKIENLFKYLGIKIETESYSEPLYQLDEKKDHERFIQALLHLSFRVLLIILSKKETDTHLTTLYYSKIRHIFIKSLSFEFFFLHFHVDKKVVKELKE